MDTRHSNKFRGSINAFLQTINIFATMSDQPKTPTNDRTEKELLKPFSTSLPQSIISELERDALSQTFPVKPAQIARRIIVGHYQHKASQAS